MATTPPTNRRKVLVADDDRTARILFNQILVQSNFEAICVENGADAFNILTSASAPQLALLDWDMPHLNGIELCQRLRQHSFDIAPWLMIVTARNEKRDVIAALEAGANDFVSKPLNKFELQARLRVGERVITQQAARADRINVLEQALAAAEQKISTLSSLHSSEQIDAAAEDITAFQSIQVDTNVAAALRHESQFSAPERLSCATPRAVVTWSSFILTNREEWVDILIETDNVNASALFRQAHGRAPLSSDELVDYFQRLHATLTNSFLSVFSRIDEPIIAPALQFATDPRRAMIDPEMPTRCATRHAYEVGEAILNVVIVRHVNHRHERHAEGLSVGDVLAENFPPQHTKQVPLIYKGAVMDHRLIEKLKEYVVDSPLAMETEQLPNLVVHSAPRFASTYVRHAMLSNRKKFELV